MINVFDQMEKNEELFMQEAMLNFFITAEEHCPRPYFAVFAACEIVKMLMKGIERDGPGSREAYEALIQARLERWISNNEQTRH